MTKLVSDKYSEMRNWAGVSKSGAALEEIELQYKSKRSYVSLAKTCKYAVGGLSKWIKDHRK